jgi:hypothetical protein
MENLRRHRFEIGLVVSALIGSLLGSVLAIEFVNESPRGGYLYGIAIGFLCLILSKVLKTVKATALSDVKVFVIVWGLVHLTGLIGFLIFIPTDLGRDSQVWVYFQSILGGVVGVGFAVLVTWIRTRHEDVSTAAE